MDRMVDRYEVISKIRVLNVGGKDEENIFYDVVKRILISLIKNMETAYDPNEVIKQLLDYLRDKLDDNEINMVCEIVRKGGIDVVKTDFV